MHSKIPRNFSSSHPKTGSTSWRMYERSFLGFVLTSNEVKSSASGQQTTKSPPPQPKPHRTKHTSSFVWSPITMVFQVLAHTPNCEGRWKRRAITVLFKFTMDFLVFQSTTHPKQNERNDQFFFQIPNWKCQTELHSSCTLCLKEVRLHPRHSCGRCLCLSLSEMHSSIFLWSRNAKQHYGTSNQDARCMKYKPRSLLWWRCSLQSHAPLCPSLESRLQVKEGSIALYLPGLSIMST